MKSTTTITIILSLSGISLWAAGPVEEPPPPVRRLVVSIPDRKAVLFENDEPVRVYDVAVGARRTPTPAGEFKVVSRVEEPTWYYRGKVVPPGPANPLGSRWMGLSLKGYGIHGTNQPKSIGRAASHGCIRMRKADIEELFTLLRIGDVVELSSGSKVVTGSRDAAAAE